MFEDKWLKGIEENENLKGIINLNFKRNEAIIIIIYFLNSTYILKLFSVAEITSRN